MAIKCVNEKCTKNPDESILSVVANADGDIACDEKCLSEYKKQRDYFFNVTVHSEKLTLEYLRGKP